MAFELPMVSKPEVRLGMGRRVAVHQSLKRYGEGLGDLCSRRRGPSDGDDCHRCCDDQLCKPGVHVCPPPAWRHNARERAGTRVMNITESKKLLCGVYSMPDLPRPPYWCYQGPQS